MIGRCSEADSPFGVLLIKEGQEVGEPAEPFTVGTTARISQVQRLEDGRMNILTEGERRFRVVEVIQQVPYQVGLVQFLEEESGDIAEVLVEEIRQEYVAFLTHQATIAGGWNSRVDVTDEPRQLFWDVIGLPVLHLERTQGVAATAAGKRHHPAAPGAGAPGTEPQQPGNAGAGGEEQPLPGQPPQLVSRAGVPTPAPPPPLNGRVFLDSRSGGNDGGGEGPGFPACAGLPRFSGKIRTRRKTARKESLQSLLPTKATHRPCLLFSGADCCLRLMHLAGPFLGQGVHLPAHEVLEV